MSDNAKCIRVWDGDDVHDVIVRPLTTAADILTAIGRESNGYWLVRTDGIPLEIDVDVYETVLNGDKVMAFPVCDGVA